MRGIQRKSGMLYSADGTCYNLEELMHEYGNDVLRTAYLYINDMSAAEDIFQEVFIRVNQSISAFNGKSSIKTWIIRITINLCKDHLKSAYQRKVVPILDFKEDNLISDDSYDEVFKAEDTKIVREAILELPIQYKEVVLCVYYQEMSMKETAKALKIPEGTVKTRLLRAKERLKKSLEGRL